MKVSIPRSNPRKHARTAERQPGSSAAPSRIPKQIGKYRIKQLIGSGGMGSVYQALQEQPRRTVAIKLMKAGIASSSALRRFEYESQLLARLSHPGIAEVYDAGTHKTPDGGVPYFVMEYISRARRITDYVREKSLSTNERLELFLEACSDPLWPYQGSHPPGPEAGQYPGRHARSGEDHRLRGCARD